MNLDIPARNSVLCLVDRIILDIGAVPDPNVEVIDTRTRLALILCLRLKRVQALATDRSCALELGAHAADRKPVDGRAHGVDDSILVLEVQLACGYVVLVPGGKPEVGFAARKGAVIIRIEPAACRATSRPRPRRCRRSRKR